MSIKYWPGDVIVKCLPFTHVLNFKMKGQRCDSCFKIRSGLKKCGGCGQFHYCDRKCQKHDWIEGHKYGECQVYQRAFSKLPSEELQQALQRVNHLLRLYLKVIKSPDIRSAQYQLFNGKTRCFNDLIHHLEEKKRFCLNFEEQKQELFSYFQKLEVEFDADLLLDIKEKMNTNSFSVGSSDEGGYWVKKGSALYIQTSIFDHSCEPNAMHTFDGHQMILTATHEIREGEEILIMYRNAVELPVSERQEMFKHEYFFECRCRLCLMGPEKELEFKNQVWEIIKKRIRYKENPSPTLKDSYEHSLLELELCKLRERPSFKIMFWVCLTRFKLVSSEKKSVKTDAEFQSHFANLKQMLKISDTIDTSRFSNKDFEGFMLSQLEMLGKKWWQLFSPDYIMCY